jgi:hypothetical protein
VDEFKVHLETVEVLSLPPVDSYSPRQETQELLPKETILDLTKIITELKTERDRIGRAISALLDDAKAAVSGTTRKAASAPKGTRRGKGLTAAGRKRLSEAMKRRWAERRGKSMTAPKAVAAKTKRRGGLTPAGRKKLSEAMKRRWAERKKKAS